MRNILAEKPSADLHGRLKFSLDFVGNPDIKNKVVLDIGCGYGWYELNFINRGVKKVYATEVSEDDLTTIKKNIHNKRVVFGVADAIKLPFSKNSLDTVVSWEVLEHIPENTEEQMFAEVARVLKPGGAFYLSTPFNSWPSKLFDPAWWLIKHRHYSLEDLRKLAKGAHLKVDKVFSKGGFWEILYSLNMYFSKWILRRKPLLQNFFNKNLDLEYKRGGLSTTYLKCTKIK